MNSITDKLTGTGNKSATHNPNTDAQNEDYADKGLDAAEKKYGGKWGQDPQKDRAVNEKITDTARGVVEHATGKHVPEKMSN